MDAQRTTGGGAAFIIDSVGAFEVDSAGKTLRSYESIQPSHDLDVLDNGNWLMTNGWVLKGEPHFIEVDPSGDVVWSWDGVSAYDREPYADLYREGWIHANSATRLDDGSTMVSLRNFNRVAMLSAAGAVEWELVFSHVDPALIETDRYDIVRGHNPHDPELTPANTVLVALHRPSMVVEVDVATQELVWAWKPEGYDDIKVRDVNRLPNGNTLVVSTRAIFELSPEGVPLWRLDADLDESVAESAPDVQPFYKSSLIAPDGTVYGG
jgi:hypothetical protein